MSPRIEQNLPGHNQRSERFYEANRIVFDLVR